MKKIVRNIIIIVVVIILGVVGYSVFFKKDDPLADQTGLVTVDSQNQVQQPVTNEEDAAVGREFLTLLLNVRSIKLDSSLFTDPSFTALQDFSRPLPEDTDPGRPNPFAPLGQDSATIGSQISTNNPSSVTRTTSTLNGTSQLSGPDVMRWFEYGTTQSLGIQTAPKPQANPGAFIETISALNRNTTYFVKAVVSVGGQPISGNVVTWKTAQ